MVDGGVGVVLVVVAVLLGEERRRRRIPRAKTGLLDIRPARVGDERKSSGYAVRRDGVDFRVASREFTTFGRSSSDIALTRKVETSAAVSWASGEGRPFDGV